MGLVWAAWVGLRLSIVGTRRARACLRKGRLVPRELKQASTKTAAVKTLATIADNCYDILAFLQAIAVKYLRVLAAPLSLCADKRARV